MKILSIVFVSIFFAAHALFAAAGSRRVLKIRYPQRHAVTNSWLKLAGQDLEAAFLLLRSGLHGCSLYHCHQAVEKALKGFLSSQGCEPSKTHDLHELLASCKVHNNGFKRFKDVIRVIEPYANKTRYPESGTRFSNEEAKTAVDLVRLFLDSIKADFFSGEKIDVTALDSLTDDDGDIDTRSRRS